MTLGNMRELGVQNLIAFCLNDACRHQALIEHVELSGRDRGAVPGEVRRQASGRAAELEGAAGAANRNCAMTENESLTGKQWR
jgi:hypothetical protein